jgi:hypothetical protein
MVPIQLRLSARKWLDFVPVRLSDEAILQMTLRLRIPWVIHPNEANYSKLEVTYMITMKFQEYVPEGWLRIC